MRLNTRSDAGYTIVEIITVVTLVVFLSIVTLVSVSAVRANQRDKERRTQLHRMVQLAEQYKNEFGTFMCGDDCFETIPGTYYSIDCSGTALNIAGNDPRETNGYMNGGDCCNLNPINIDTVDEDHAFGGFPAPTSTDDDSNWGLWRHGFLDEIAAFVDPIEGIIDGKEYSYCYATEAGGRTSYAVFTRLEQSDAGSHDGGLTDEWFEIRSSNYSEDGWYPGYQPSPVCGNFIEELGEQCDDGNTANNDGCSATCQDEVCGDFIKQSWEKCDPPSSLWAPVYGGPLNRTCRATCKYCGDGIKNDAEQCDDGNNIQTDSCRNGCTMPPQIICGNGICDAGEQCDVCWQDCGYCVGV